MASRVARQFTIEELEEEYDLPYGGELSFERIDKHRWYTIWWIIWNQPPNNRKARTVGLLTITPMKLCWVSGLSLRK
jgi:hypothetical protein